MRFSLPWSGIRNTIQRYSTGITKLSFAFFGVVTSGYTALYYTKNNTDAKQNSLIQQTMYTALTGFFIFYFLFTLSALKKRAAILPATPLLKQNNGIYSHDNFADCIEHLLNQNKAAVAFFDLDNTLIVTVGFKPNQTLHRKSGYGSDFWFTEMAKKLDKNAQDYQKMYLMLLHEYFEIQRYAHQMATEDCVPEKLALLRENNIPIFGLTARSDGISEVTLQWLKKLNIHFTIPCKNPIKIDAPAKPDSTDDAVFKEGIIFCSGRSKKLCLDAFFQTEVGKKYFDDAQIVLFMDDRHSYCEEVHHYLSVQKKETAVVHYTHVEKNMLRATEAEIAEDRKQLSEKLGRKFQF